MRARRSKSALRGRPSAGFRDTQGPSDGPRPTDFIICLEREGDGHRVALRADDRALASGLAGPGRPLTIFMLVTTIASGDLADRYLSDAEPAYASLRFRALAALPERADLVEEYVARVRAAQSAGDRSARAAHAWYLLRRVDIERGALAGWAGNFDGSDVGDEAMRAALEAAKTVPALATTSTAKDAKDGGGGDTAAVS